jgi:hypothetical protein
MHTGDTAEDVRRHVSAWDEAKRKDRVEVQACRCVCAGRATLAEAQHDLAIDWQAAYHKYALMVCRQQTTER